MTHTRKHRRMTRGKKSRKMRGGIWNPFASSTKKLDATLAVGYAPATQIVESVSSAVDGGATSVDVSSVSEYASGLALLKAIANTDKKYDDAMTLVEGLEGDGTVSMGDDVPGSMTGEKIDTDALTDGAAQLKQALAAYNATTGEVKGGKRSKKTRRHHRRR